MSTDKSGRRFRMAWPWSARKSTKEDKKIKIGADLEKDDSKSLYQTLKRKFTTKKKRGPISFEEWRKDFDLVEPFEFDFTEEREELIKMFNLDEEKQDPEHLAKEIPEKTALEMVQFQRRCCIFHHMAYKEACERLTSPPLSTVNKYIVEYMQLHHIYIFGKKYDQEFQQEICKDKIIFATFGNNIINSSNTNLKIPKDQS